MRICFADVFFVFLCVFYVRQKNMRQPFSGTAERIFMKLLPNDRGECSLKRRAAAWRKANVDLRNLRYDCLLLGMAIPTQSYVRYDSGGITRGRHARRLRYTTMSGRMDVI